MALRGYRTKGKRTSFISRKVSVKGFKIEVGIIEGLSNNYPSNYPDGRPREIIDIIDIATILMEGTNIISPRPWISIANRTFYKKFRRKVQYAVTNYYNDKVLFKKHLILAAKFLKERQIEVLTNAISFGMEDNNPSWLEYKNKYPSESSAVLRWSDHLINNHKIRVTVL